MKTKFELDNHQALRQHQRNMQKMNNHHQNEMTKAKLEQTKQLNEMRNSHQANLINVRNQQDRKIQEEMLRNETILTKLKQNLDEVKEQTNQKLKEVEHNFSLKKEQAKNLNESELLQAQLDNDLRIRDLNHESQVELNKLQRQINSKRIEQNQGHERTTRLEKDLHNRKMQLNKQMFRQKQQAADLKYVDSLHNQRLRHENHLATEEQKHQLKINERTKLYQDEMKQIEDLSRKEKVQRQKKFEKFYKVQHEQNEGLLKKLVGNKEKLIKDVQDDLTKEFELGIKKSQDDFYHFGKLKIQVNELPNREGYTVSIPVAEHESKNVQMRAENRELRFTMERHHQHTLKEEGRFDSVKRVDSYVTKVPVERIIDPKTITKDYENGNIIFTIKNA